MLQTDASRRWAAAAIATLMLSTPLAHAAPDGSGISDGVVRIAVLGDYGSGRDLGGPGSVTAAKLAAEDFHNKVLGKPIEIISADHQNKPDVAVGIARQWFDVEHVDAVTDLAVSSVGLAVAGLATQSRHGRSIRYAPNYAVMGKLVGYLIDNCSGGEGCGEVPGCGVDAPSLPAPMVAQQG